MGRWLGSRNGSGVDFEQPSFTDIEYGNRRRVSEREQFPETMDATIPWQVWVELIEPHYYADRPGKKGRKAKPTESMPRMYLLQVWFNLSDEGVVDAIYDSYAMRRFMRPGLRCGTGARCRHAAALSPPAGGARARREDASYQGAQKRPEIAEDEHLSYHRMAHRGSHGRAEDNA